MKVKVDNLTAFQVLQTAFSAGSPTIFYAATGGNVTRAAYWGGANGRIAECEFAVPLALATFQAGFPGATFRDLSPDFEVTE